MSDCGYPEVPGSRLPDIPFHGTRDEQKELVKVVVSNIGECKCHPAVDWMGNPISLHVCPTHAFLNEKDEPDRTVEWTTPRCHGGYAPHSYGALHTCVSRLDRLMFAKRMRGRWLAQEGIMQLCPKCEAVYQVSHDCRPVTPPVSSLSPENSSERLPW